METRRTFRPSPRWLIALVPMLAACSPRASTGESANGASERTAVTAPSTTDDTLPTTAATTTSTAATDDAESAASTPPVGIPAVPEAAPPASIEPGTDAAAVWDALMSPVGEYAAWALYGAVLDRYGDVEPYATIQAAEGRHVDALVRQLERLGIEVPDNPYIGVVEAPDDLVTAAANWATGEVANIELYDELLEQVAGDARLTRVFTNLRRASADAHLPMFTAAAAGDGTLSDDELVELGHRHT